MRPGVQETDLKLPVEDLPRRGPSSQAKVAAVSKGIRMVRQRVLAALSEYVRARLEIALSLTNH